MRPPSISKQLSLHSVPLTSFLDPLHELVLLAMILNWKALEAQYGAQFKTGRGRPPVATRVMVALHLLKYLYDEGDESLIARFVENPYWQHFCGFHEFQREAPCDSSSLTRWRRRMGEGIEAILRESLNAAKSSGIVKAEDFTTAILDTTVQEKAVTPPTDGKLLYKIHKGLLKEARARGIEIKRPWLRKAKEAMVAHARLRHGKKHKDAKKKLARMRTLLRRLERQVVNDFARLDEPLVKLLRMARTLRMQSRGLVPAKEKIYSVHAPEVECIGKGKAHKPWEFGVKVSLAVTATPHPLVMAAQAMPGAPYDGATMKATLASCERMTGEAVWLATADRGYRGTAYRMKAVALYLSGTRKLGGKLKRFVRRRSAIEPVIGHVKESHKMRRNRLLGEIGDQINAILSGAAWNLAQLMRWLAGHPKAAARLLLAFARLLRLLARLALASVREQARKALNHLASPAEQPVAA
jgi:IS5 family transposase